MGAHLPPHGTTEDERLAETDELTDARKRIVVLEETVAELKKGIERMATYLGVLHVLKG